MIMNQREAAMQTGEMFDGPNMRLGDDWNNVSLNVTVIYALVYTLHSVYQV